MEEKYDLKGITVDRFKDLIRDVWKESKESGEIKKIAEEKGLNYSEIEPLEANDVLEIKQEGVGLDPALTAIIVSFAPVLAEIAEDIWKYVLLPKIKRKEGDDVLTLKGN